ncbi:hypothetical protein [Streptomyces sp. NPDC001153]
MDDRATADAAHVAHGLSGRHPTAGTRAAGQLEYPDAGAPTLNWEFPGPPGHRPVIGERGMQTWRTRTHRPRWRSAHAGGPR